MAATISPQAPPPPPPPMPGTAGAYNMPNWRDTYQPAFRETAPTKEQIERQQYAHLPDKLLNTMNKDKKPFTYTPSGVSSEKGVLDLSEIRSPKMKKRLLANLHAGDDETETTSEKQNSQPTASANGSQMNTPKSPNQYGASPFVLPPFPDANSLRSPSPSFKKEVRFAPSPVPVMACDNNELIAKLAARKQDVEARSKIVTNEPLDETDRIDGKSNDPAFTQPPSLARQEPVKHSESNFDANAKLFEINDMNDLCAKADETVRKARGLFNDNVDYNNNHIALEPEMLNNFNNLKIDDGTRNSGDNLQFQNKPPKYSNQNAQPQSHGNSDILKHVLDSGLQDEIDKFEEIGAKMGSSSPEICPAYYPRRMNAPPPPVPPKPSMYQHLNDGRTSCPPFSNYQPNNQLNPEHLNSFRCISPSIEILKRTQNTGYNYITKPRPFYRSNEENEVNGNSLPFNYQPVNSFNHLHSRNEELNGLDQNNERLIPVQMENGYSSSLPRKIKFNSIVPGQPRFYENPELGREYLPQAGMFSQLPPKSTNDTVTSPIETQPRNKMYYGINSRSANSSNRHQSNNAIAYVDPEANREYLPQAGMFSQLPPSSANNYSNDNYNSHNSRQSSLPPHISRSMTPSFGTNSYGTNSLQRTSNKRITMSELRKLPPSERPHEPPPSKYTGANIPSRSFRILQLITGEDVPNQFVQNNDDTNTNESSVRRSQPPPTPPPRSDSYRPISQQTFRTTDDNLYEPQNRFNTNNTLNQTNNSQSSFVYASSAYGTDF